MSQPAVNPGSAAMVPPEALPDEGIFDSITHTEERLAQLKEGSDQAVARQVEAEQKRKLEQDARDEASRLAEAQLLTDHIGLVQHGDTRELLLDRIREMREEKPPERPPLGYASEDQKAQLAREQEAGRAAVAKAEADAEKNRLLREQAAAETRAREGGMSPVVHPNPGQKDQFPAEKATLGIKK
jgi:hypothetical protein